MMRIRFIVLIVCVSLVSRGFVFAEWCPNEYAPSEWLTQYIATIDVILGEVQTQTASSRCDSYQNSGSAQPRRNSAVGTASAAVSEIRRTVNQAITFDNFFLSSQFYFDLALKWNVPSSFMRDNTLIQEQQNKIQAILTRIHKRCAADTPVTPFTPAGVKVPKGSASAILNQMIANNIAIHNLFRKVVLGHVANNQDLLAEEENLLLVQPWFATDLLTTYGSEAYQGCIVKGDYWNRIIKRFDKISGLFKGNNRAIRDWIDAWNLLFSSDTNAYRQTEKRLLAAELERQGFSASASEQMLKNLDSFNSDYDTNGPTAILRSIGDRSVQSLNQIFSAANKIINGLRNAVSSGRVRKTTVGYYRTFLIDVLTEGQLAATIKSEYIQNKAIIGIGSDSASKYSGSLYALHVQLMGLIQRLESSYKIAESACKKQKAGMGVCSY